MRAIDELRALEDRSLVLSYEIPTLDMFSSSNDVHCKQKMKMVEKLNIDTRITELEAQINLEMI